MSSSKKSALVTGVTGQDGGHLAALLHDQGYEVFGLIRGQNNSRKGPLLDEFPFLNLIEGTSLTLSRSCAQSTSPPLTNSTTSGQSAMWGTDLRNPEKHPRCERQGRTQRLEAVRFTGRAETTRVYQASTSEMFGGLDYNRPGAGYDESSLFHPRSPVRRCRLYGHWIAKNYRGEPMACSSPAAFCSIMRASVGGQEFVTRKITCLRPASR